MLAMDPNRKAFFPLPSDQDKPADTRPEFQVRFPSARRAMEIDQAWDAAFAVRDDIAKSLPMLLDVVAMGVCGCRNVTDESGQPWEWNIQKLPEVLTFADLWQLAYLPVKATRLTGDDAKKSVSPSPSAGESSAAPAATPA